MNKDRVDAESCVNSRHRWSKETADRKRTTISGPGNGVEGWRLQRFRGLITEAINTDVMILFALALLFITGLQPGDPFPTTH